jgi:hypothetical protein
MERGSQAERGSAQQRPVGVNALGDGVITASLELHHAQAVRAEARQRLALHLDQVSRVRQEGRQVVGGDGHARVEAEGRPEAVGLRTLLRAEQAELETMIYTGKEKTLVAEAEDILQIALVQQHFAEVFGAQVGVNTGRHDITQTAFSLQQAVHALQE